MNIRKAILVVGRTKQEAEEYASVQLPSQPVIAAGANQLSRLEGLITTQVIIMDTVGELDDTQVAMLHRLPMKSLPGGQSIDSILYRRTVNAMRGEIACLKEELATLKGM